jgi:putative phosphoesterase
VAIGCITDIHGNTVALDAVLADAESVGIDRWYVLGDLVAIGPDPVGVVDRLRVLPNATFVRGNTERYLCEGWDGHGMPWTRAQLGEDRMAWLASLPLHARDGSTLLVHASPGRDDGPGIDPRASDAQLRVLVRGCKAERVVVGHTHQRVDRVIDGVRLLNPGSVGQPVEADLCAGWLVLDGDHVEHRRVAYDREAVIRQTEACGVDATVVESVTGNARGMRVMQPKTLEYDPLEYEPPLEAKRA